jgi:hypothetical protein
LTQHDCNYGEQDQTQVKQDMEQGLPMQIVAKDSYHFVPRFQRFTALRRTARLAAMSLALASLDLINKIAPTGAKSALESLASHQRIQKYLDRAHMMPAQELFESPPFKGGDEVLFPN